MSNRDLIDARAAIERFAAALESAEYFDDDLALRYNWMREALALQFQSMARSDIAPPDPPLTQVREDICATMRSLFGSRVEEHLLGVRGYASVHPALYALLLARIGEAVPGWRLRMLTADQVHTERRARELRDLGFDLSTWQADDYTWYQLSTEPPDLVYAAAFQLRRNAIGSSRVKGQRQSYVIKLAEDTADLPPRRASPDDD